MCCCIDGSPVQAQRYNIKTYDGTDEFQTKMLTAPFHDGCTSMCWCFGQCFPYTCGCTQYLLRRKVLDGDMSRYVCCQGYVHTCGFGPNMVDPCDYRLIRINNCLQMLACICDILGAFIQGLETLATFINRVADLFFHCVSGCMTAQVASEINFRKSSLKDEPDILIPSEKIAQQAQPIYSNEIAAVAVPLNRA